MFVCVSQMGVAVPWKTHPTIHSIYWHAYYHGNAAQHILLLNGICQTAMSLLSGAKGHFPLQAVRWGRCMACDVSSLHPLGLILFLEISVFPQPLNSRSKIRWTGFFFKLLSLQSRIGGTRLFSAFSLCFWHFLMYFYKLKLMWCWLRGYTQTSRSSSTCTFHSLTDGAHMSDGNQQLHNHSDGFLDNFVLVCFLAAAVQLHYLWLWKNI